jgi:hypothetical protein
MATAFEEAHADQIVGCLTTVDRLIIHGHLTLLWRPGAFPTFLLRQGIRFSDFARYVWKITDRVKKHAKRIAKEAGRPFIYQAEVVRGKDDLARAIAKRDGITKGLVCVLSTLEMAKSFAFINGRIIPHRRKCLHFYFYVIDAELGFMHVRLQSWFPFQIQIYLNGREWLARQLDKRGIGYFRYENTFLRIDDLRTAERLCASFTGRRWWRVFNAFARRVNPVLPVIQRLGFGSYYWAIDACEVATDLMWKSRRGLLGILDDLFDHALRAFSASDVIRFLGRKILPARADVTSAHKRFVADGELRLAGRRPDGRRIKHRIRHNWIKMYDKWSVPRIETVINYPYDFKVLRFKAGNRGRRRGTWVPMNKGIQNLRRYVEVGAAANRRYLDALTSVRPTQRAIAELDHICEGRVVDGARFPKWNPVAEHDCQIFRAVLAGEHAISGFRNRDLQARLYRMAAAAPDEAKRRCSRVCRIIAKLRGHGLVAKVPGSRLYRVTSRGHRVMSAALRFRHLEFPEAVAA